MGSCLFLELTRIAFKVWEGGGAGEGLSATPTVGTREGRDLSRVLGSSISGYGVEWSGVERSGVQRIAVVELNAKTKIKTNPMHTAVPPQ